MNKYYSYPNIDLWKTENWSDKVAPLGHLIQYIQEHNTVESSDYVPTYEFEEGKLQEHPLYRNKTHGIDDPGVVAELNKKGIHYLCTGQGGGGHVFEHCWICLCPQKAIDNWNKLPVYIFFGCEDEYDPRWTMRALKRHWDKVEMLERSMDFILVLMIDQFPCYDRIYFNIIQEFSILFPCDINRMYMDVASVTEHMQLKAVPNFELTDEKGNKIDPDSKIEAFGDLKRPVINIKGLWGNCDSLERGLVMTFGMNAGRFDREWMVHSEVGKRMASDMLYEYKYDNINDPAFIKEIENKGLIYRICFNELGERYLVACPRQQYEEKEQIPVVLILQEVYEGNEHLAVTAHSYCAQWLEIAAQGECCVIFYVLEDIVSNDRALDIVKKCAEEYPLDLSRVYLTGHSHDGYFTYAMANRNPDFAAAIAVLGMGPCPHGMNDPDDFTGTHPICNYDIPEFNACGVCESRFPKSEEDKNGRWVDEWKFIMRNHRIPAKTDEQILAAFDSTDHAQKVTCLPGDSFTTLWAEGIENYIVDFINVDGKKHLRCLRQQNMPHTVTPFMCTLSWDFMRRFRRNPETKEIEELY